MIEPLSPKPKFYGASPTSSVEFNIDEEGKARIFRILRSSVYSKRILAVIREVCANAWDSHVMSGCPNTPIKVTLPTKMSPDFVVRDYGAGLSHEEMIERYPSYGFSSKRSEPNAIGCLGLGCKAPFAYSDSFVVTTFRGGFKRVYNIYLDGDDREKMDLSFEGPTEEPDGLSVRVPVKPDDVSEFHRDSVILNHMVPPPKINIPIPSLGDVQTFNNGILTLDRPGEWFVLMGFIPYDLEVKEIQKDLENAGVWELAKHRGGYLKVSLGDVSITPSRESVRYDDTTKKAIVRKFIALKHEVEDLDDTIRKDTSLSDYERIMWTVYLQSCFGKGIDLQPWKTKPVMGDGFRLYEMTQEERRRGYRSWTETNWTESESIETSKHSVFGLIFVDDKKSTNTLKKMFSQYTLLVEPRDGVSNNDALASLEAALTRAGWGGMPITLSSKIRPKRKTPVRSTHKKPRVTVYKYFLDNWQETEGPIPPNSVVVPIQSLRCVEENAPDRIKTLLSLHHKLKIDPPNIYGVKLKQFTEDPTSSVEAAFDRLLSFEGAREKVTKIVEEYYRDRKAEMIGSFMRELTTSALPVDHPFRQMICRRYTHTVDRHEYCYRHDPLIEEMSQEVQKRVYDPFEQKYPFIQFRITNRNYGGASEQDKAKILRLIEICDKQQE